MSATLNVAAGTAPTGTISFVATSAENSTVVEDGENLVAATRGAFDRLAEPTVGLVVSAQQVGMDQLFLALGVVVVSELL